MTVAKDVLPSLCNDTQSIPLGEKLIAEGKTGVRAGEGLLKYPSPEKYAEKRSRRIIQMTRSWKNMTGRIAAMTDTAVMDYQKILMQRRKFYFACCLVGAFFVGLAYTWSVLQSPFIALLGGDAVKSTVVLCYTVTVLSSTMSPSILGGFIKKLGTRRTIALGSILFGAGYVISGYTTSMAVFFLAFGLGTGVGSWPDLPHHHGLYGKPLSR